MVTMAQRIAELRSERGLSRPALSAALGFPRMAVEKFETGRQTPTQDQQEKLASFFGVSVLYLRGENNDRVRMDDWMDGPFWTSRLRFRRLPENRSPPPPPRRERAPCWTPFSPERSSRRPCGGLCWRSCAPRRARSCWQRPSAGRWGNRWTQRR